MKDKVRKEKEPEERFFMFTLLQPLILKQGFDINILLDDIFSQNAYPYLIINNREDTLFKLSQENAPRGFIVQQVIFALTYNKQFFA